MSIRQHDHLLGEPTWFRSSYSDDEGANCVEVAAGSPHVLVRDSKLPHGSRLAVEPAAWAGFVRFAGTR